MNKRPKPADNEDDILQMQEEFLKEKRINNSVRPSASVVNLRPDQAQNATESSRAPRIISKYAASKSLVKKSPEISRKLGDVLEKSFEVKQQLQTAGDIDEINRPIIKSSVLGNIIEKNVCISEPLQFMPMPSQGFPTIAKRIAPLLNSKNKYPNVTAGEALNPEMEIDEPTRSDNLPRDQLPIPRNLPSKSYIIDSEEGNAIHHENLNQLKKMTEEEILEEQQKLFSNLDPKLISFITSRRKTNTVELTKGSENIVDKMETESSENLNQIEDNSDDSLWENDVLSNPNINTWMHFNTLEKDKLEWMNGIQYNKKIKPNEPYEARFDFNGYLLPYTIEYTEKTKTLFHHGDEAHRPGYSLTELFELTRSTVIQQRVLALNIIAGVLEYYSLGTYKDVIELPLSKILFVVRFAVDENKVILLEPALKALRNLIYNRIDEGCLDALLGLEAGREQPSLENDKSEIDELESKESDLKDFHLAEIDIITALLRTDIIQRLYYILNIVKPNYNCVQYSLQILIRLARDSVEIGKRIIEMDHLMNTILKNFVPTTSINFYFEPGIVYKGKPILSALKLFRILSLQSKDIGLVLVGKYDILQPLSEYISSGVDGTYGMRLQIEAFSIISNLLHYQTGLTKVLSLSPIIVTTVHKHVKGTDVFNKSSTLSILHASVVIQLVNKMLSSKINNLDDFKCQVYPLLQEGTMKWFTQITEENYTCGHLRLLCSVIDCCKTIFPLEKISKKFLIDTLQLLKTKKFAKNIISSSNLLSGIRNEDLHLTKNLMCLGSSVIESQQKVLPVLNTLSPIPFYLSLFKLLEVLEDKNTSCEFVKDTLEYLDKLSLKVPSLCDNWFTRIEMDFVNSIVKVCLQIDVQESNRDIIYMVASKLCYMLRIDKNNELECLFQNIIFNKSWFTAERLINLVSLSEADCFSQALKSIETIKLCYNNVINLNYQDSSPNIVLKKWQEPILPRDWIYLPILNLYMQSQDIRSAPAVGQAKRESLLKDAKNKIIVVSCLEWILFNELCFPDLLKELDITDRYCRVMCVFLCDNSLFLDPSVKLMLHKCLKILFKMEKSRPFSFDKQLSGLNNFQDFYTQFLEQFQSVSYGDHNFAACVLVPLAQKHSAKWRKLLWSEYAGCLRVLDCPEDNLCYKLEEYFYPEETDESLIHSYARAFTSNLLRPNTIAYKIAEHHVKRYRHKLTCK